MRSPRLELAETQAAAMYASELVAFFLTLDAAYFSTVSPRLFEFREQQTVAVEIKSRSARSVSCRRCLLDNAVLKYS
jgi:hypothetical protein